MENRASYTGFHIYVAAASCLGALCHRSRICMPEDCKCTTEGRRKKEKKKEKKRGKKKRKGQK